ncbi:MAG: hypothetical protein IPL61_12060 [Myxococcales bacterium]|nr:hypothetical protein [Myxococcales bacterium]
MAAEDLLSALSLPDWLVGPALIVAAAAGLAVVTGLPTDDVVVDTLAWTGACGVVTMLVRWYALPYARLGEVIDTTGLALVAAVGPIVGVHRIATVGADAIALVGLGVGALGVLVLALIVRRRRRRRR